MLGVTVGMLVRRTLPAMAITLVAFVAVQIAMPLLVRPRLLTPDRADIEITEANATGFSADGPGAPFEVEARPLGSWALSSRTIDASGRVVKTVSLTPRSPACLPTKGAESCFAEIKRLGYRQRVTYLPASRFWPLQWAEVGISLVLALALAGFCFRRIRRLS